MRSAWSKWDSIAEDIEMRSTDISILTEVWQKEENKRHQKCIESMLELRGIKYVSTPRPGAQREGGVALACSQERFTLSKLNILVPKPLEACFALVKPKNPTGKSNKTYSARFTVRRGQGQTINSLSSWQQPWAPSGQSTLVQGSFLEVMLMT